jgi:EmrB/QacA subfamily drug resistance transporter
MTQRQPFYWGVLLIVSMAIFILVIDTTIMNVSISALVEDLNSEVSTIHSIIAIYTLVMAAFMLIGAKLQDILGRKRAFMIGLAVYGVGTFTASISQNAAMLLFGWSLLEGIGAVLMLPATATFITGAYEGRDRAIAFGIWGGIAAAASAFGPIVGGFLTTFYTWRLAFLVELIIVFAIFALHRQLTETSPTVSWKGFDLGGSLLSVLGLVALVFGILQLKEPGNWKLVPFLLVGGLFLLAGFYLWEKKRIGARKDVLVDVTIIPERSFFAGNMVATGLNLVIAGFLFIFPLFFQTVTGASAYDTGVILLPMSFGVFIFAILGAKFSTWFEPKYVLLSGIALTGAGLVVLKDVFSLSTTGADILPGSVLFGIGMGIVLSQITNITLGAVGNERQTDASGIYNTTRQLGSSLGTSIIGIVLAIGFYAGIPIDLQGTGLPAEIPPEAAQWVTGMTDAAVNQGMEYAFVAMILVVVGMFIAALFIRKTGKIM